MPTYLPSINEHNQSLAKNPCPPMWARANVRVIGDDCEECGRQLGETFHVVAGVVKCDGCFAADKERQQS